MLPPRLWGCMISSSTTLQVCPSTVPSQPPSPALPGVLVLRSVRPPPSAAVTLVSEMARHASIPQAGRAVTGSVNGPGHETRRWLSCSEERERGRDQVKKKKREACEFWSLEFVHPTPRHAAGRNLVVLRCPDETLHRWSECRARQAKIIRNFKAKDRSHAIHSPSQHTASVGWRGTLGERPASARKKTGKSHHHNFVPDPKQNSGTYT